MSVVQFYVCLVIAFVHGTYGQQGVCTPPKQTGVISFVQEKFFGNTPANFGMGTHPSGIQAVVLSSAGLQKAVGLKTTRALYDGVAGYVQKINCTFYYFPSFGCATKPFPLYPTDEPLPNVKTIKSYEVLNMANALYKPFPYCIPCSSFSFRTFSGPDPSPTGQLPSADVIFEFSNIQACYITGSNYSGYYYAKAAQEFAAERGYSYDVTYDNSTTVIVERKCPPPPKCKRTPNNLYDLSYKDIPEITSLQSGSACYWASTVSRYLSSKAACMSQLFYVSFGLNKPNCGGMFFGEGYIPSKSWESLFDPIFFTYCS